MFEKLKQEFNARPLEVTAVISGAAIAVSKVLDTVASARSKNAYAKQINRSSRKKK